MKKIQNSISNFFSWLSKTELVELDSVDISEDPIRPEYDNEFRNSHGRKIYGLKSNENIEGFICIAFCNDVPQTMKELDLMSKMELLPWLILSGQENVELEKKLFLIQKNLSKRNLQM